MVVPKSLDYLYPPRLCRFFFLVSDTHRNRTAAFLDYHVSTFYSTSPIFTSHSFRSAVGTTEGYLDLISACGLDFVLYMFSHVFHATIPRFIWCSGGPKGVWMAPLVCCLWPEEGSQRRPPSGLLVCVCIIRHEDESGTDTYEGTGDEWMGGAKARKKGWHDAEFDKQSRQKCGPGVDPM